VRWLHSRRRERRAREKADQRDRDILILVSEGRSRREIAHDLWRDEQTIKKDLERILSCLPDEDAEELRGVLELAEKRRREEMRALRQG
jgi:DNA-binding NarL/FixJ family response regulator